jgi:hypothetical protein
MSLRGTRRDWQDILESRIDQESSVIAGMHDVVSSAEEAMLPKLRDTLVIVASPVGKDLDYKAKWVSDRFVIDAKASGCQKTTRIAQAIETLQGLLFGLRTGQFNLDPSSLSLMLEAENFDEEWKWIGSYATWRAAMFVFLYPENLLLPNLKNYKTPAFEDLITKLRLDRRVTAQKACEAAKQYAAYIKDVCSLRVEATCQTKSKRIEASYCQEVAVDEKYYLYLFGRAESGKVYWSVFDPNDTSEYPQRPWRVWPFGNAALRIAGATPYKIDADRQFIYVFFVRRGTLPTTASATFLPADVKISFARFDLNKQDWDGGITDLPDPPGDKSNMRVVVHQGMPEKFPPLLAIWPTTLQLIQRPLNGIGDGWLAPFDTSQPEWEQFAWDWGQADPRNANAVKPLLPITDLHAAFADTPSDHTSYHIDVGEQFVTAQGGLYRWHEDALGGNEWLGMYFVINSDQGGDGSGFWPTTLRAFFIDAATKGPVCAKAEYTNYPFGLTRGPSPNMQASQA